MPSPILARANALMHRRRGGDDGDEIPVLTDAIIEDDDIPVLLDIEAPSATSEALSTTSSTVDLPVTSKIPLPPDSETLLRELARRIEERLQEELPFLIEATLLDLLAEQAAGEGWSKTQD